MSKLKRGEDSSAGCCLLKRRMYVCQTNFTYSTVHVVKLKVSACSARITTASPAAAAVSISSDENLFPSALHESLHVPCLFGLTFAFLLLPCNFPFSILIFFIIREVVAVVANYPWSQWKILQNLQRRAGKSHTHTCLTEEIFAPGDHSHVVRTTRTEIVFLCPRTEISKSAESEF